MEDFSLKDIQPYIFVIVGLASVIVAVFKKSTKASLKLTGQKAEGIIYALGQNSNSYSSISQNADIKDKVTVRFLTQDQQWITGDLNQDFATFFTRQYKEGNAVDVYYDPKQPSNFYVDTKQSETTSRIIFAAIGLIFSAIGLYQVLIR